MLVLSVTDCPPALRGDLSKWLLEIDTGVYVGKISQRVREELWQRMVAHLKTGKAIMVYTARNEQGMDFRIHNASWEPIDFDGLKLMLKPSALRQSGRDSHEDLKPGFSKAAKNLIAKRVSQSKAAAALPADYVIIDLETTGLKPERDEIIEIGAIKYHGGQERDAFQALVMPNATLPAAVANLTGLDDSTLRQQGKALAEVLPAFFGFIGNLPIISHNLAFDVAFLLQACTAHGMAFPPNKRFDTLSMSRHYLKGVRDFKLSAIMAHFNQATEGFHRSLADCRATAFLWNKLIEIKQGTV